MERAQENPGEVVEITGSRPAHQITFQTCCRCPPDGLREDETPSDTVVSGLRSLNTSFPVGQMSGDATEPLGRKEQGRTTFPHFPGPGRLKDMTGWEERKPFTTRAALDDLVPDSHGLQTAESKKKTVPG